MVKKLIVLKTHKLIIFFISLFFLFSISTNLIAADALTIKQQLDRLMEEIEDLNKAVFNKSYSNSDSVNNENFTAIDIRIYDLEKDIKNLTLQIEELIFMMDDLNNKIDKVKPSKTLDKDLKLLLTELEARLILLELNK